MKTLRLCLLICLTLLIGQWSEAAANNRLAGRILLQTQSKGEAWYINPVNGSRYLFSRPEDLSKLINAFGLKIKAKDLLSWRGKAPSRLAGRFLIDEVGKIYYVHPLSLKPYGLGQAKDAFNITRGLGLKITNADLTKIKIGSIPATVKSEVKPSSNNNQAKAADFSWQYKGRRYQMNINLSEDLYQAYQSSLHYYKSQGPPPANWRNDFYGIFLQQKAGDNLIKDLVRQLKDQAATNGLSDDETVELASAFTQSIPYDTPKAEAKDSVVNFPYETLYKKLGICSDKTVLAVMLFRELGYGAAVLVYPERNHSSAGIECPAKYALPNTNYCFVETTDFFPVGFVPQSLNKSGVAQKTDQPVAAGGFLDVFNPNALGEQQVYQASHGKVYQGMAATYQKIEAIKNLDKFLVTTKNQIDSAKIKLDQQLKEVEATDAKLKAYQASGNIGAYNQLVPVYNDLASQYNEAANFYKIKIDNYNQSVADYDQSIKGLYVAGK